MLSLNIPLWKLFGWFRRLQLWATGDWQLHHNNTPTHAPHLVQSFLVKHQITQVAQHPYSPDLALQHLAFPKTKITFEREVILDHHWDSGKCYGVAALDWENCVRSLGTYFEGDWGVIVLCTVFLVSCIFFNACLLFIGHGWILSGQTSYVHLYT